jgi:hypothetical protein
MSYRVAVGILLLLGSGCSNIPKFDLAESLSIPWLKREPSRGPIGVLSVIRDPTEKTNSAPPEPTTWNAKKGAALGGAAGSLGGTALGLATCAPFLGGPPLYAVCAAGGMGIGFLAGLLAGGIIGDTVERRFAWHSEVGGVIAALPGSTELAERLHLNLIQGARTVTTREVVDVGTVVASQLPARQAISPATDILIVRSMDISAEQLGDKEFRIVLSVHAELNNEGWLNYLMRSKYSYEGPPISQDDRYDDKLAAAMESVSAALQEISARILNTHFSQ